MQNTQVLLSLVPRGEEAVPSLQGLYFRQGVGKLNTRLSVGQTP